eukprot:2031916-Amphidinium_carterae.1
MAAPRPHVFGLPSKAPGSSDRYPILVRVDAVAGSDSQLPKWVAYHKSWREVVLRWCSQLLDPLGIWQERLTQVQDVLNPQRQRSCAVVLSVQLG